MDKKHQFCYGVHDGSCYIDHMETPPFKRCLNCSELVHPNDFAIECNPKPLEPLPKEYFYMDWIPITKWPEGIK